ncbi:unnamed protein product, partial [Ectocarpus sp. 6 AP-2014]
KRLVRRELLDRPTVQPPQTQRHTNPPHYYSTATHSREQHATKFFFPARCDRISTTQLPSLTSKNTSYLPSHLRAQPNPPGLAHVLDCRADRVRGHHSLSKRPHFLQGLRGEDAFTALLLGQGQGCSEFPSPRDSFSFTNSSASCLAFARAPPLPPNQDRNLSKVAVAHDQRPSNLQPTRGLPLLPRYRVTRPGHCQNEHGQETSGVNNNQQPSVWVHNNIQQVDETR